VSPTQKNKKIALNILLTHLSFREIKKVFPEKEKLFYIDVSKIIAESFGEQDSLSDVQYWILNQMIIKKIEGFRASKAEKILVTIKEPNKNSIKSFRELLRDHKITPVLVEILNS
jgi:hypothetical protein